MSQTIKVSTKAPVVILAFHRDAFGIAQTGHRAGETMAKKMQALLTSRYGTTAPTFEQYRADRAALKELAKSRKLADDQWIRKPFCAAVIALFGALPEAQTPEAIAKREQRAAADAAAKQVREAQAAAKAGAPAGQTQDHPANESEQLQQLITRIGLLKVVDECINIMEADDSTKAQAVHMRKMAAKVAEQLAAKAA